MAGCIAAVFGARAAGPRRLAEDREGAEAAEVREGAEAAEADNAGRGTDASLIVRLNPSTLDFTSLVPCLRAMGVTNRPIVRADAAVDRPSRIKSGSSERARLAKPIGANTKRSTATRCASRNNSGADP